MQDIYNHLYGVLTILICCLGYYFSWKYSAKGNYKFAILFLIFCGLLLRVYVSADSGLHRWDERYHALVAKNLIKHPFTPTLYDKPVLPGDYKDWLHSHIWLHKQPIPLWSMALSMWLFGVNVIALRLPSIILSTLGIWLTFVIGSYFFDKKTGFVAAFLYSINGFIVEITGGRAATDHIDLFFLVFIELSVFFTILFIQRKKSIYNILTGISIGVAILCKWLPALIVLPIWILIVIDSKQFKARAIFRHLIMLSAVIFIVAIPWQIYIHLAFPHEATWESNYNLRHLNEVIENHGGPWHFYLDYIRIDYGDLIYLPLLWFLYKAFRNAKDLKMLAIVTWFLLPLLFFSIVKTKMEGYILFIAPSLLIITAVVWNELSIARKDNKYKWVINLALFLIIAMPVRYAIERIKPFEEGGTSQWVTELKNLNNDKRFEKGVLFNYPHPIEAMFYSNLTAYSEVPDSVIIKKLIAEGQTVVINDSGSLANDIKTIQGPVFVHLDAKDW